MSEHNDGALALVGGGLNRPTASEHFTVEAWRLLTGDRESSQAAVAAIRTNPNALAAIKAGAVALQEAVKPCGDTAVRIALQPCAVVYGSPWDTDEIAEIGLRRYYNVLSGLPLEALLAGIDDYDRVGKHFPRPSEILVLAEKHAQKLRIAAGRARLAAERLPSAVGKKRPEDKERERQALIDAGHMNPDGTMKPLVFKQTAPLPPSSTPSMRAPKSVAQVLAADPHLKALAEKPIPRGPVPEGPKPESTELF